MMQNDIGKFIQDLRKEQGITQKQLADKIGISDKTVSKWENGNGMPDTSLLIPLCEILDISVNELLSCEKLPPEDYSKKAEENIMVLLKDKENNNNKSKRTLLLGGLFGIATILFLFATVPGKFESVVYFIDFPSVIYIAIICAVTVFASGEKGALGRIKIVQKTLIPAGMFLLFFSIIIILGNLSDLSLLGPSLAVAVLSMVYSLLVYIILIPIISYMERKKEKSEKELINV